MGGGGAGRWGGGLNLSISDHKFDDTVGLEEKEPKHYNFITRSSLGEKVVYLSV